jgi:hypothetical protein
MMLSYKRKRNKKKNNEKLTIRSCKKTPLAPEAYISKSKVVYKELCCRTKHEFILQKVGGLLFKQVCSPSQKLIWTHHPVEQTKASLCTKSKNCEQRMSTHCWVPMPRLLSSALPYSTT